MSSSERFVQFHKQQTDRVIRNAYAHLRPDVCGVGIFDELLHYARKRAPRLLEAPVLNGRHPGVEAIVHLSRFGHAHIRRVGDWSGIASSWRLAVASLAHHLVCRYEVPRFLSSAWYSNVDSTADERRAWFVAHGRGASFRSLNLPVVMTRRMEHIFLKSQDHLSIEHAIRRAELLALGAPDEFVNAILSTLLALELSHGDFWRTFWMFLIADAQMVDPGQIGPMIDFIHTIRHERVRMETPDGIVELEPPQPSFSIKGRTVQSMLRLMGDWDRSLGVGGASYAWPPSGFRPMLVEEPSLDPSVPPKRWQMIELTTSTQLQREGAALHHCVVSYVDLCRRGVSRIWSLRCHRGERIQHVLTIEVDNNARAVIQARGRANRAASGKPLRLLQVWAARERLRLAL